MVLREMINNVKCRLWRYLNIGQAMDPVVDQKQEFLNQVRQAHADWQCALNNFNYCTDSDMVDYYIYNIDAAEKKYICLIKRARKENLTADLPGDYSVSPLRQDC